MSAYAFKIKNICSLGQAVKQNSQQKKIYYLFTSLYVNENE